MNNAGTLISIALSMAIVSSRISPETMQALFVGTQVGSKVLPLHNLFQN